MSDATAPAPGDTPSGGGPTSLFRRLYGRGPFHLIGHVVVIGITAYVLSMMFQARFAPQPLNLALWLLGGAVLHDGVFLPIYGVLNTAFQRATGAGDGTSLKALAMGPAPAAVSTGSAEPAAEADRTPAEPQEPTRDQRRAVPLINHVRTPVVISAVLFLVFLPRILDRQPQNFVNALGHEPPDFLARWLFVTAVLFAGSAVLYGVRRLRS
ncbi:MAG: hypothetical protein Q7T55_03430 [Solirubrobacteraceae bacterium]|nr:hypothetical protein [Solirubrobacteraceae bacterium]